MLLNLNSIMSVIFNVPAAVASTVSDRRSIVHGRSLIGFLIFRLWPVALFAVSQTLPAWGRKYSACRLSHAVISMF